MFCFHSHHLFTFVGHKSGSKIQTGQIHTHTHICIDFYTCTLLNQTYIGVCRYVCWYIAMYIIQCYAHSFSWIAEKTTTTTTTFDVYDTMTLNHWILGCWCCCCFFFFCFRLYVFVSFVIYTPQFLVGRFFVSVVVAVFCLFLNMREFVCSFSQCFLNLFYFLCLFLILKFYVVVVVNDCCRCEIDQVYCCCCCWHCCLYVDVAAAVIRYTHLVQVTFKQKKRSKLPLTGWQTDRQADWLFNNQ